jgi:predicted nucleotidyltransferase
MKFWAEKSHTAPPKEAEMLEHLPDLPPQKRLLLEQIVAQLRQISGVAAVVLGGSYAGGTQHAASDLDIGLYYAAASPFSIPDIRRVADELSAQGPATVTDFYGWGAWVNGGAWIHTRHGKVDFLYRNLDQVRQTIAEAHAGIAHHDYDQQPTHGFYSTIYLAETQICIPLYDPAQLIAALKREVATYPPGLKQRIIADSLWAAEFTLLHAHGFAARGDVYNTVGCLTRTTANLTQALFALNERYFLRDKQVMETIAGFPTLPRDYAGQIQDILAQPGRTAPELSRSVAALQQVWESVTMLPGVDYTPKFQM